MLAVLVLAAITLMVAETNKKEIIAVTPLQVRWFTPSYYTDGRQRAHLLGDSSHGGAWIDRAKIPAGKHVRAHAHPQDEPVTVIDRRNLVSRRGNEIRLDKAERVPSWQFHRHPGGRASFCCGEGRCRDYSARR